VWTVKTEAFENDDRFSHVMHIEPMDIHVYTVVLSNQINFNNRAHLKSTLVEQSAVL